MSRLSLRLFTSVAVLLATVGSHAFSLVGPVTAWQTPRVGYTGLLGPRNINEDYRYNVPTVYWAVTPDFLSYFGKTGVQQVEKAMAMLNAVPAASQLAIDGYPLEGYAYNYRAQELRLLDLKSTVLSLMLPGIGVGDPTSYVYTLRSRWLDTATPPNTNFYVIRRNFDPVTWEPTPYINGQLWTYDTILDGDTISLTDTVPVDPLFGYLYVPISSLFIGAGRYVASLTRDDVGGIRFIYRPQNYNVETAVPTAFGGGGGPWSVPGATNAAFVNTALRPGVDKVSFQQVSFDSLLGFYVPITNLWTDKYVTNYAQLSQTLQRPVPFPDVLFDAGDLVGGDSGSTNAIILRGIVAWQDNEAINGVAGNGMLGPGQIPVSTAPGSSPYTLTFSIVGRIYWNIAPTFLSETDAAVSLLWGSFDGSTNEPIVYPSGLSIRDVESAVLDSSSYGGQPWTVPGGGTIDTNAPAGGGTGG